MGANMLLTLGGIVLLSTFVLYANGLLSDNTKISGDNEYAITAISLAQSVIDEAKTKSFDENAIAGSVTQASDLTAAQLLGRDGGGEAVAAVDTARDSQCASYSRFDDVDDYNGYVRLVNTPRAEGYRISTTVSYASATFPDSVKSSQTFCKRMTVTVTSPFFAQPIQLMYAFTY
ncbi:MAG: hypothetical protein HY961_05700 [Ignavibacteriae bacterium]|nr:hypothetical protein [Ignavibacteriota bacterium]